MDRAVGSRAAARGGVVMDSESDGLDAARGIVSALGLSVLVWALMGAVIWLMS